MSRLLHKIKRVDHSVKRNFSGDGFGYSSKIDVLFKWLPMFSVFIFDLTGIKTKSNSRKAVKIIAFSETLLNMIILPLKKMTKRRRPDDFFKYNSFPSGHTATSFMGAEILRQEMKETSPEISLAGYGVAITTATLRLYKKKHWLSDVIIGATIGIISAQITYNFLKK